MTLNYVHPKSPQLLLLDRLSLPVSGLLLQCLDLAQFSKYYYFWNERKYMTACDLENSYTFDNKV